MSDILEGFAVADDVRALAVSIIGRSSETFRHVDLEKVEFLRCTSRKNPRAIAECRGITGVLHFVTDYRYIIVVNAARYDTLSQEKKEYVITHELMHISTDFNGSVVHHDVEDFSFLIRTHGVDFMTGGLNG